MLVFGVAEFCSERLVEQRKQVELAHKIGMHPVEIEQVSNTRLASL